MRFFSLFPLRRISTEFHVERFSRYVFRLSGALHKPKGSFIKRRRNFFIIILCVYLCASVFSFVCLGHAWKQWRYKEKIIILLKSHYHHHHHHNHNLYYLKLIILLLPATTTTTIGNLPPIVTTFSGSLTI